jgi:hypothetical protein
LFSTGAVIEERLAGTSPLAAGAWAGLDSIGVAVPDIDPLLSIRQSRAVFDLALRLPCKRHAVKPGEGCWTLNHLPVLCGSRLGSLPRLKRGRR